VGTGKPRIGVVGLRRGASLARACRAAGLDVVAVCDVDARRLAAESARLGVEAYAELERFLAHPMDAVVLANHFDEHARLAIRALEAGLHVLSETVACTSAAEGAALIRAVERSGRVYQLVENYAYKPHVLELRRRFLAGELGELVYAEAEYLHGFDPDELRRFAPDPSHWRARIASTDYCTHTLAPVMHATGAWPVSVSAQVIPFDGRPKSLADARRGRGAAAILLVRTETGALVKSLQGFLQGEQPSESSWVRLHGSRALAENLRHGDARRVRVRREAWASATGAVEDFTCDPPTTTEEGEALPAEAPDDFLVCRAFERALRGAAPPFFDVFRGVAVSLVGPCALASVLREGVAVEIPDLRDPGVRARF
jgi:predicted dehydrogenase